MEEKTKRYEEIFEQVMALYSSLREANEFRVKRAEMRQGECAALPIDFCADVEIKASKALRGDPYAIDQWRKVVQFPPPGHAADIGPALECMRPHMVHAEYDSEPYKRLPVVIRERLGQAFYEGDLGPNGAYRSLYGRLDKA